MDGTDQAWDRPPIRRYTVELTGGQPAAPVTWGNQSPHLRGWDLSWTTSNTINSSQVEAIIECREDWFQAATLQYGDSESGVLMQAGGTVFIPYPTFSVQLVDQNGSGGDTVELIARPVMCGEVPKGEPRFYGVVGYSAEAGSGANVSVPKNANLWAYARAETDATPIKVEAIGQTNKVFWSFTLDASSSHVGALTQSPWRTCPPMDASGSGTIKITNGSGEDDSEGFIHFVFDLGRGR